MFGDQGWFFQNGGSNGTEAFGLAPGPWALAPGQFDDYDPDIGGDRVRLFMTPIDSLIASIIVCAAQRQCRISRLLLAHRPG